MEKITFFDTETTGVPKDYNAPITDLENWPRIIQFAWQVVDFKTREVLREVKTLIKPNGWEVPSAEFFIRTKGLPPTIAANYAKFWTDNGFSQAENIDKGQEMEDVLDFFINDIEESDLVVAHNMGFDLPVTSAEMLRYGKRVSKKVDKFCTMRASTNILRLPGRYGYKFPKLEELHQFLFKKGFQGAHDAGNDVSACRDSFFGLIDQKHIKF